MLSAFQEGGKLAFVTWRGLSLGLGPQSVLYEDLSYLVTCPVGYPCALRKFTPKGEPGLSCAVGSGRVPWAGREEQ